MGEEGESVKQEGKGRRGEERKEEGGREKKGREERARRGNQEWRREGGEQSISCFSAALHTRRAMERVLQNVRVKRCDPRIPHQTSFHSCLNVIEKIVSDMLSQKLSPCC